MKSWRVMDYGEVPVPPVPTRAIEFTCLKCMNASLLPVVGIAIAQLDKGLIFEPGKHAMPKVVQCRHCRTTLEVA